MKNLQTIIEKKLADGDAILEYKDFRIEIDEDNKIVRIMKDEKMIKFWYDQDTIQIAKLPKSSDIINEYNNIFKN